ncbi:Uncharacterised protein [Mycobacteroides abscessus subsp. abscessus]|nr:Uncharacterised protein [Mycobacteroides abscessus subsp. abscessus]SIC59266.1 Uncharacterised protein [Mycobacteroides abscessus subsp. abscessus]SKP49877.1 Uncharacterised protein [Mycobacteroides abscessus subsp. abscessus]
MIFPATALSIATRAFAREPISVAKACACCCRVSQPRISMVVVGSFTDRFCSTVNPASSASSIAASTCRLAQAMSSAPLRAKPLALCRPSAAPRTFTRSPQLRSDALSAASPSHTVPPGRSMPLCIDSKCPSQACAVSVQCVAAVSRCVVVNASICARVRVSPVASVAVPPRVEVPVPVAGIRPARR